MILTGRPVGAAEAQAIGLANRVVPTGTSLDAARELATNLARFPQATMRGDRASVYAQEGLDLIDAMAREYEFGQSSLATARDGAGRFTAGQGRHGAFDAT
jgi:enoyl-CoA hydratase